MIYCNRYKKLIVKEICDCCIFLKIKPKKCNYNDWNPGLKKGRDTTAEEIGNV